MDNKILVGFGVVLAIFLAFPFVAQQLRGKSADTSTNIDTTAGTVKVDLSMPSEPPLWNSTNIIGTQWEVDWEGNPLKMTIAENGLCYVTHPLMRSIAGKEYVDGQWRLEYDKAYVDIIFGTKEYHFVLSVRGNKIYDPDGKTVKQL